MTVLSGILGTGKFLGKELLQSAFPDVYAFGVRYRQAISKKKDEKEKETPAQQAINQLNENTLNTNSILQSSLEVQLVQNAILEQILQGVRSLQESSFQNKSGPGLGDIIDPFRRKPKGARPLAPRPKPGYTFDKKTGRYRNTKTGKFATPEEATGKRVKPKKAPSAPKRGKSISDFVYRFLKKRAPKLAAKITARIGAGALAAGTGIGIIITLGMAIWTLYDIYEIYQLWEEYNNESETEAGGKDKINALAEQDQKGIIEKESIEFNSNSLTEFKAREMTIKARDLVINGMFEGAAQKSAIGTTRTEQQQAQQARETAAARLAGPYRQAVERRQGAAQADKSGITPGGAALPGGASDAKQIPPEVLAQAEQLIKSGRGSEIEEFMRTQGYPKPRQWCGAFVASVVKASGGDPKSIGNPNVASNWQRYGESGGMLGENTPKPGSILVSRFHTYGAQKGQPIGPGMTGGHVMIFKGVDPKTGEWIIINPNPAKIYKVNPNSLSDYLKGYEIRRAPEESSKIKDEIIPKIEKMVPKNSQINNPSSVIQESIANNPSSVQPVQPDKYEEGGIVDKDKSAQVGEKGSELILSGDTARMSRVQAVEQLKKGDVVIPHDDKIKSLLEKLQEEESMDNARQQYDREFAERMSKAGAPFSNNIEDRRNDFTEYLNESKLNPISTIVEWQKDIRKKSLQEVGSFKTYKNLIANREMDIAQNLRAPRLSQQAGVENIPQTMNFNPWTGEKLGSGKVPAWQEREILLRKMYNYNMDSTNLLGKEFTDDNFY